MRLIGGTHSPFVRRIAMVLQALGQDFDQESLRTADDRERILAYNPVGRVPALALGDGRTIIDSHAIIDWLERHDPAMAELLPVDDEARMQTLYADAIGIAGMEKLVLWFYENTRRDPSLRCAVTVGGYESQIGEALAWLDARCPQGSHLVGEALTLADITATSLFNTLAEAAPSILAGAERTNLESLAGTVSSRLPAARP